MDSNSSVNAEIKASAEVKITPHRSQIFVSLAMAGAVILACLGCFFIYQDKAIWWPPIGLALLLGGGAFWSFKVSHANSEMFNPIASELSLKADEIRLVTDPRVVEHNKLFGSLASVFTALQHQRPLPLADALLDPSGVEIPNSKEAAAAATQLANEAAELRIAETLEALTCPATVIGSPPDMDDSISSQVIDMRAVGGLGS